MRCKPCPASATFIPTIARGEITSSTTWREVARRYGFVEYDGPVLEPMELYEKKSGGELVGQLFDFVDKGERHVAHAPGDDADARAHGRGAGARFQKAAEVVLRPAILSATKSQQRGRLREFYQLNCDIIGEASPAADAEMIAVLIDMLRALRADGAGFRRAPQQPHRVAAILCAPHAGGTSRGRIRVLPDRGQSRARAAGKDRRRAGEVRPDRRRPCSTSCAARSRPRNSRRSSADLTARGLGGFVEIDYAIVRGLAYYTGVVFEVFDRSKNERALAGGGRYDQLLSLMSDGKVDLPALGFGMGDVVLAESHRRHPRREGADATRGCAREHACDLYVVIAKEERRPRRSRSCSDCAKRASASISRSTPAKVGKQFQTAEQLGARLRRRSSATNGRR